MMLIDPEPLKVPVIVRDDYVVYLEHIPSRPHAPIWVHCEVGRWTVDVARRLRSDFNTLRRLINVPIWTMSKVTDKKHNKFVRLFGFKQVGVSSLGGVPTQVLLIEPPAQ